MAKPKTVPKQTIRSVKKIVVVGAGRVGEAIIDILSQGNPHEILALDIDRSQLKVLSDQGVSSEEINGNDVASMSEMLIDADCVICAAPPSVAQNVARAANAAGCHYVDVCEDVSVTDRVAAELTKSDISFVLGCGLAPGLVSTYADAVIQSAPMDADITAYVGVLPETKSNRLGYGDLWGVDGLMAEYFSPCHALKDGQLVTQQPLEELEKLVIEGTSYEAFTTSGTLSELARRRKGRVQGLIFKTLRYPGHLDYVRFLLDDLKLSERRYIFRNLLLNGLPKIKHDKVILQIVSRNAGPPSYQTRQFSPIQFQNGKWHSAVSAVTAQHVCCVVDLLIHGNVPKTGALQQIELSLDVLGRSRYARTPQPIV